MVEVKLRFVDALAALRDGSALEALALQQDGLPQAKKAPAGMVKDKPSRRPYCNFRGLLWRALRCADADAASPSKEGVIRPPSALHGSPGG